MHMTDRFQSTRDRLPSQLSTVSALDIVTNDQVLGDLFHRAGIDLTICLAEVGFISTLAIIPADINLDRASMKKQSVRRRFVPIRATR